MNDAEKTVTVLVPSGMLGGGFTADSVRHGIDRGSDVIAIDGGSTDSGPHYLGRGIAKTASAAVRRDLEILVAEAHRGGVPLVIGSCGTSGTDSGVDWVADILREVCRALEITREVALIYSEQDRAEISRRVEDGAVRPLPPAGELSISTVEACDHIVGLMGHEPIAEALRAGADIVLAGRASDTAVVAAYPLLHGTAPGPTWHAAKIAECGGLCTTNPRAGGVLVTLDPDGFEIEPLAPESACTPTTVSAHLLYENAHPHRVLEPGGELDTSAAIYTAVDDRRVRVEGSLFRPSTQHTIKLEGAGQTGYETISLVGVRDPEITASIETWTRTLEHHVASRVESLLGLPPQDYAVSFSYYGWNAVLQDLEPDLSAPKEFAVLLRARAETQAIATSIAKIANPLLLHLPLPGMSHLPSFAFATSPAEVERGPVFEFKLQHVVETSTPHELFRTKSEVFA